MKKQFGLIAAIKFLTDLQEQGKLDNVDLREYSDKEIIETATVCRDLFEDKLLKTLKGLKVKKSN